ncbi:MAG: hypothetical protein NUV75_04210, partial [Gallionella sp.]|nr:hypothetical protein [Gallionella sp.]
MKLPRYFCLLATGLALCLGVLSTNAFAMTGTASQYFTQKAVGNTWSYLSSSTCTGAGCPPQAHAPTTYVSTITASVGGVVTHQKIYDGYTYTGTEQIDATGAWIWMDSDHGGTYTVLPATFSVGTTWVSFPAMPELIPGVVDSGETSTIAAFNVTRTVPAGTFTDCLQINTTITTTVSLEGYSFTSVFTSTVYYSPTVGNEVEHIWTSASSGTDSTAMTFTGTDQLQSYSVASTSPTLHTLAVTRTGSGLGTITSDSGGINCGATCWADYTSGASVTLTATPATGSYFQGWGGACSG